MTGQLAPPSPRPVGCSGLPVDILMEVVSGEEKHINSDVLRMPMF